MRRNVTQIYCRQGLVKSIKGKNIHVKYKLEIKDKATELGKTLLDKHSPMKQKISKEK